MRSMDQSSLLKILRKGDADDIKNLAQEKPHLFQKKSAQGNNVLHLAAKMGNKNAVEGILDVNSLLLHETNPKGETPMHVAVAAAKFDVADALINSKVTSDIESEGVNILRMQDNEGNTPLHIAVKKGHFPLVKALTETGRDNILRMQDNEGNTPLHIAVKKGHFPLVKALTEKDPEPIFSENTAGLYPMSIALDSNLKDIACFILEKKPDSIDHKGSNDMTLLHKAVIWQDYDLMIKILKMKKELIFMEDIRERNVLHYAAASGNDDMVCHLTKDASLKCKPDNQGQTPIHLATKNGNFKIMKMLLEKFPDEVVKLPDCRGRNILHLAALYRSLKIVLLILKSDDHIEDMINSPDEEGNTPLHLAAMHFHSDVVYVLTRDTKVDIKAKNESQQTALLAAQMSSLPGKEMQKYLTIKALKVALKSQSRHADNIVENWHLDARQESIGKEDKTDKNNRCQEIAQMLLVITTLVATFTFTAALSIPGGYRNDGPDAGMAILISKASFQTFIVANTIASTSSMTAGIIIVWCFLTSNEMSLYSDTIPIAMGLTWTSLIAMALAFVSGLFVVLSDNLVLAIAVCAIGCSVPLTYYIIIPSIWLFIHRSSSSLDEISETNPTAFMLCLFRLTFRNFWKR